MRHLSIPVSLCVVLTSGTVFGQAASRNFYLVSHEQASGGTTQSTKHVLTGSHGAGAVASAARSSKFALAGGFVASFSANVSRQPRVLGCLPRFAPLTGGTSLTLHGAGLALGSTTAVKIGGKSTSVSGRSNDRVLTSLPAQDSPGWKPIEVTTNGLTTTLPKGVGVLPLAELERPAQPDVAFQLDYRGTRGDLVMWAVAIGNGPSPIPLMSFRHGLELNAALMLVFAQSTVTNADGTVSMPLPAASWARPIHIQGLAINPNAAYKPGSFTNVVRL